MLLFELDFEEVSKKKLRECWSQLCRIRCSSRLDHKYIEFYLRKAIITDPRLPSQKISLTFNKKCQYSTLYPNEEVTIFSVAALPGATELACG